MLDSCSIWINLVMMALRSPGFHGGDRRPIIIHQAPQAPNRRHNPPTRSLIDPIYSIDSVRLTKYANQGSILREAKPMCWLMNHDSKIAATPPMRPMAAQRDWAIARSTSLHMRRYMDKRCWILLPANVSGQRVAQTMVIAV